MFFISKKKAAKQTAEAVALVRTVSANALYDRDCMIERQERILLDKQAEVDELTEQLKTFRKSFQKATQHETELKNELAQAMKANGELKRQLDEANKLLRDADDTNSGLQQLLTLPACGDCPHANKYHPVCASCTRNPHARDKYYEEKGKESND